MKLDVTQAIRFPGQEFPFEGGQTIAPQEISGDTVVFDDAQVKGMFSSDEDGNITVDGQLTTVAHAHCANCLEPASADIQASFRETFLRNGDPEDDEIFAYAGSSIGFEKLVMSCAVLELPIRILCKEDCPGLLESSGEDNDARYCQEEMPNAQHPFAALQQLLTKDEEV